MATPRGQNGNAKATPDSRFLNRRGPVEGPDNRPRGALTHTRRALRRAVKTFPRLFVELVCLVVPPKQGAALVYSAVPAEANAVEVVRWLRRHELGSVTWLVDRESIHADLCRLLGPDQSAKQVVIRSVRDVRWILRLARSELFFFTHPLLGGMTSRDSRRVYVNLWHGDGPKISTGVPAKRKIAHFTVAGTRLWGNHTAWVLNSGEALICGNPRIDQYQRPATDKQLTSMGVDPSKKLVVWAPTFRMGHHVFGGTINHTLSDAFAFDELLRSRNRLQDTCDRSGVCLALRPHPLDRASFDRFGLVTVSDDALMGCGIGLYQFLARAAAIVSDYSSIWTDFLILDRPIAIYCPDIDTYMSGFFARKGALEPSPSPLITSVDQLLTFLRLVGEGVDVSADHRARACSHLGAVLEIGATERVMSSILPSR